ncbi:MAG TPA: VTT domain-containing protein [Thermodesulfobacteriota bacterium]|nr:VTT domain-containing protein [Thermodesulfobacteriota bacterium]
MLRKLYNWVLHWAETRYAIPALILVAFAESSFFPIPPDPLLMALCLGIPRRSLMYAAVCSMASVVGGLFGYYIGWGIWEIVDDFFLTYVFSSDAFLYVSRKYEQNAFLAILGAAFTPIPYKVFTVAAGVFKIDIFVFILASAIGRSARFFIEGGLIYFFGAGIKTFIDKYFNILVTLFFILLVLGFLVVKYWMK